jgi:hypothetical protein
LELRNLEYCQNIQQTSNFRNWYQLLALNLDLPKNPSIFQNIDGVFRGILNKLQEYEKKSKFYKLLSVSCSYEKFLKFVGILKNPSIFHKIPEYWRNFRRILMEYCRNTKQSSGTTEKIEGILEEYSWKFRNKYWSRLFWMQVKCCQDDCRI